MMPGISPNPHVQIRRGELVDADLSWAAIERLAGVHNIP